MRESYRPAPTVSAIDGDQLVGKPGIEARCRLKHGTTCGERRSADAISEETARAIAVIRVDTEIGDRARSGYTKREAVVNTGEPPPQ